MVGYSFHFGGGSEISGMSLSTFLVSRLSTWHYPHSWHSDSARHRGGFGDRDRDSVDVLECVQVALDEDMIGAELLWCKWHKEEIRG